MIRRGSPYIKGLVLVVGVLVVYLVTLTEFTEYSQVTQPPTVVKVPDMASAERQLLKAISKGVVTKVTLNNSLHQFTDDEEKEKKNVSLSVSMLMEKRVHRENPPQNRFQWLYNDQTTLVYSAHYDNRDSVIKIVGFKHRFNISSQEELVLCKYPDGKIAPMTTLYNISVITPRPGLEYNTWVWVCPWRGGVPPPQSLTLTTQSQHVLLSSVNITYHTFPSGPEKAKKPILCVKPMVNNYSDSYQLREFIEMSRLMGAGKIVIYPYSINEPLIRPILDHYKREGLVDTHEWVPPVPVKSLHAYGQKSHNQHCLYTYMYKYQWAAFIDLDELIVFHEEFESMEFMIQAGLRAIESIPIQSAVAGFIVRSQMCTLSLPDDPLYGAPDGVKLCRLTSLRKTNCTIPMKLGVWSKPLVNTDGTEVVDIHMIRLTRPGFTAVELHPSLGTVHHYRALKHTSQVLAESKDFNVRRRNTHLYKDKARERLGAMCDYNNPTIGDVKFAD